MGERIKLAHTHWDRLRQSTVIRGILDSVVVQTCNGTLVFSRAYFTDFIEDTVHIHELTTVMKRCVNRFSPVCSPESMKQITQVTNIT